MSIIKKQRFPLSSNSFTILHLSDLESALIFQKQKIKSTKSHSWNKLVSILENGLEKVLKELGWDHIDLFVISGDCISSSDKNKQEAFRNFVSDFVMPSMKILSRKGVKHLIIVPGNHDVERQDEDVSMDFNNPPARLNRFDEMIQNIRTKFKGKYHVHTSPRSGAADIEPIEFCYGENIYEVFPLNSALLSGASIDLTVEFLSGKSNELSEKDFNLLADFSKRIRICSAPIIQEFRTANAGSHLFENIEKKLSADVAFIPPAHLDAIGNASASGKRCRIAVVHHNSLPYPGETAERAKPYTFFNSGAFHQQLLAGDFHYVLHGHQHEARSYNLTEFKPPTRPDAHTQCTLFIGAEPFGSGLTPNNSLGFNVIRFTAPTSETCHARIVQAQLPAEPYGSVIHDPKFRDASHAAMLSLRDDESQRKMRLAENLFQECLATTEFEKFNSFYERQKSNVGPFYSRLRQDIDRFSEIRGLYSVSVFDPYQWGEQRLSEHFAGIALRQHAQAAALANSVEGTLQANASKKRDPDTLALHFQFSEPLFEAISTACSNALKVKVASKFSIEGQLDSGLT